MRASLRSAVLLAVTARQAYLAQGAVVEAGSLTSVAVEALLYDTTSTAADGGCSPVGCVGANTRDGDSMSLESRWSCKPGLGSEGSVCSITYTFDDALTLTGLNVALYLGDTRTRTMDVYVDGALQTSWTSSGTTTDFESIDFSASGEAVELRGVLADSEWISIMEVEILADDGSDAGAVEVEAGTLSTVTATAALYDSRLADSNGCDPDGCTAALTRDGDLSDGSRWSCSPSLGGTCSVSYDLGAVRTLSQLRLAMYRGDTRVRTVDVFVDGTLATTWSSSGTTSDFEGIDLSGYSGQDITVTGVLGDSEWISIVETEIMVLSDGDTPPTTPAPVTPAPVFAPVATPEPTPVVPTPEQPASQEIGTVGTVTTSATFFDTSVLDDGGCDPAGCTAALTRDGDYAASSRWSCAPKLGDDGDVCTITYDLGQSYSLAQVMLAMYRGTERQTTVEVRVDGTLITTWTSSGTTDGLQSIVFTGVSGQVVEVTGVLDDSEWLSIVETQIMVWPDDVVTPPSPTPSSPTPAPVDQPVTPAPTGELATVGLLPLADCTGCSGEDLPPFYSKDGDFSTSWTCTNGNVGCILRFDLFYYRHIKQIKIALPDGAERSVDMRISAIYDSDNTLAEAFVTSSGTTDGFETYEFDAFTNEIIISGVFSADAQTISISEVEFVEELQDGVISVSEWDPPAENEDDPWNPTTDGFKWTSDADDVIDRTVDFELASYAIVDGIEILFPAGDTYLFDLVLNDDSVRGETLKTVEGWESADSADWQYFDLTEHLEADEYLTEISLVIKGTGSGAPGFKVLDVRVLGTVIANPTDTVYVGSTFIQRWTQLTDRYPDFVALGTGDQATIMEAICTVKKASFDGVDCVGEDDTATGTVFLPQGSWYVNGNIFMKSGVFLDGSFSEDEPYFTGIILEEGAAGNTDIDAMVVMDGISNAQTDNIWIRGHYDPDTSNDSPAVPGLGSTCLSVVGSTNLNLLDVEIRYCDGDAMVVRDSTNINIDAGEYEELYTPWSIASSRGTGLTIDASDSIWIRRHTLYENGVAGLHITASNNVTFDATIGEESTVGEGNVGTTNGQQPIEVIVESSSLVTFNDLRVQSSNDPIMTITDSSAVSFNGVGLTSIDAGTCVIQTDDPSTVTVVDDELALDGTCYVRV